MPRKNRGYKKNEPFSDASLFVIVAEGEQEDDYFRYFQNKSSRVRVKVVQRDGGKSSPKHFLERVEQFKEEESWVPSAGDSFWFVLDVDRWNRSHITDHIKGCNQNEHMNIAISNPCFEVWLLYHFLTYFQDNSWQKLKRQLHEVVSGGYSREKCTLLYKTACENSRNSDTGPNNPIPARTQTKVYLLMEELMKKLDI
ncbi:MAG: RloB family protein [Bacteroidota bacterium]